MTDAPSLITPLFQVKMRLLFTCSLVFGMTPMVSSRGPSLASATLIRRVLDMIDQVFFPTTRETQSATLKLSSNRPNKVNNQSELVI